MDDVGRNGRVRLHGLPDRPEQRYAGRVHLLSILRIMAQHVQARGILLSAACGLLAFAIFVLAVPTRAEFAETAYQANLIRLQAFLFGSEPKAVLVGSSISGRMLSSYFDSTPLRPLSNLGLDGSGPVFGLKLVSNRPPAIVIVEANRFYKAPDSNDVMLHDAMEGRLFRAAQQIPFLRADRRPSSLLYSWVKLRREGNPSRPQPNGTNQDPQYNVWPNPAQIPLEMEPLKKMTSTVLRSLREKGSYVVVVRLPTGHLRALDVDGLLLASAIVGELELPTIDLESECLSRGYNLEFTDGIHMTPASARHSSQLLAELVEKQRTSTGTGP